MKVNSAEFIIGAASPSQFPPQFLPEVAFAGKSNVGKSSLLNALLNRKKLVKTSGTPGKTRQINFFLVNQTFRVVDLPGYGFSRASKAEQAGWEKLIETYLRDGPFLQGVVLIVDVRHRPSPLDRAMVDWLRAYQVPNLIVANKTDKIKKSQLQGQLRQVADALELRESPLPISAKSRAGTVELAGHITHWLEQAAPRNFETR